MLNSKHLRFSFLLVIFLAVTLSLNSFNKMNQSMNTGDLSVINTGLNSSDWVDNGTIICNSLGWQDNPQVCSDNAGGGIIVWDDTRSGAADIYAQRIDSEGFVLWTQNGVPICTASNEQSFPRLCSDGNGGAIITWNDKRNGTYYDIYAQRIDSAGNIQWTPDGINICNINGSQSGVQICSDGLNGAIITWSDQRNGSSTDIYAQRVNSSGSMLWALNGTIICNASNTQNSPVISSDGANGAIITWSDMRSGDWDLYAQRINPNGIEQWTINGVPICIAFSFQFNPQICSDGASGALITWQDYRSSSNYDIYGQHINSAGVIQWTSNGAEICLATNDQSYPQICYDGAGGAFITWDDSRYGTWHDIYAQHVNSIGITQWTSGGVDICNASYSQTMPQICSDGVGGAYLTWNDMRGGTYGDIYAQRVNSTGSGYWVTDGVAITTAADSQASPQICADGKGGAVITWIDYRSSPSPDIYARRIGPTGSSDFDVEAPSGIQALPNSWTSENSFTVSWTNPIDPSGIVGAYYKLDSAPTTLTDGSFTAGSNIQSLAGISVSGSGAHDIYIWLKDGVGNVNSSRYGKTTLYLSEPAGILIPMPFIFTMITIGTIFLYYIVQKGKHRPRIREGLQNQ